MKKVRIGAGSAFWGDMLEPAVDLVRRGDLHYIGFDHLAELTLAILRRQKRRDPSTGFIPDIVPWMEAVLPHAAANHVRVITNGGGANPERAAQEVLKLPVVRKEGLKVGVVLGDDVTETVRRLHDGGQAFPNLDTGESDLNGLEGRIVGANAYLGSEGIADLIGQGADVVITGRNTDNSLFVAPLMHEFGWRYERDIDRIAAAIVVGHIIECTCMCMGGASNFWDQVPQPWNMGFPLAEVDSDGTAVITKLPDVGGMVTTWTVKEHLVYEIHDPRRYVMADGIPDLTTISLAQEGPDRVRVSGVRGAARPDTLKVLIAYDDGYMGEATVLFPWPNAVAKARHAESILRRRYERWADRIVGLQIDRVGVNALTGRTAPEPDDPNEVGVRVAFQARTREDIDRLKREIVHLWTVGGAGAAIQAPSPPRPVIGLWPTLIPRADVPIRTILKVAE